MIKQITNSLNTKIRLKDFDPSDTFGIAKNDIEEEYAKLKERFIELQEVFVASKKFALLIILQGMDCSGKDGTVKNALAGVNPNGFAVESFKQPTPEELGHDYLWRVHKVTPVKGNITVFNRSYEDVLVTRVHENIDDKTALNRFKEIRDFEDHLVNNSTIVLKLFLNISKEFQQKKLESRLETPKKYWKFSALDLVERKFWDKYQEYYEDVISNCSTKKAPWYVIPADNRWFRDYIVLKIIVQKLETLNLKYPDINGNIEELIKEVKQSI